MIRIKIHLQLLIILVGKSAARRKMHYKRPKMYYDSLRLQRMHHG